MSDATRKTKSSPDLYAIFPPQWSPFQPFLSLPSLKAYLKQKGFEVTQSDWNIAFYEYFIGKSRLQTAKFNLEKYISSLPSEFEEYRTQAIFSLGVLNQYDDLVRCIKNQKSSQAAENIDNFHEAVVAFRRLLQAFSAAEPVVEVGTSSFTAYNVLDNQDSVSHFTSCRSDNPFIDFYKTQLETIGSPKNIGISIIGTEQILPGLTLGRMLKEKFPEIPVIIGGSVFSRLVDTAVDLEMMFGKYFDYICRHEGERPMEAFLASSNPRLEKTPSLAFMVDGKIEKTQLCTPLTMNEIPTPDFDDVDLSAYYTPEPVLPVLTTRGCYWDKCAFCYHGMIYGDRYRMRAPEMFAKDIETLNKKYGVRHFALNDEAIPPKLFEKLPKVIPENRYFFTGLYKFEKYFKPKHYEAMHRVGFRSLYIGLESASERVQKHMRKDNLQVTMASNLRDAHDAGIWNHTFNFFGFPTETREEAYETINFLIENADIIHSEGTGTFSFEHNAPISKSPLEFGVTKVIPKMNNVLELYYEYEVESGLTAQEAGIIVSEFIELKKKLNVYSCGDWIPREHLLLLLSYHSRNMLHRKLHQLEETKISSMNNMSHLSWFTVGCDRGRTFRHFVVDTKLGRVIETNHDALILLRFCSIEENYSEVVNAFPVMKSIFQRSSASLQ